MTTQEAIKSLRKLKSFHNGSYGSAIAMAIEALEKQIPKKPIFDIGLTSDYEEVPLPYCSVCGGTLCEDDVFCCDCGQAISWEGEE